MKPLSSRRSAHLGLAIAAATLLAGSAEARAETSLLDAPRSAHGKAARAPLVRVQPARAVLLPRPRNAELTLSHSLERGSRKILKRHDFDTPLDMRIYGMRTEPVIQFQMKREMLLVLARVTGETRIVRAAMTLRPTSALRGVEETLVLERTRARGTFLEIEELLAPRTLVTSTSSQVAFASTGAALFASAIGAQRALHATLGEGVGIYPRPWPMGIMIAGSFSSL